jgi:hypothetical protein
MAMCACNRPSGAFSLTNSKIAHEARCWWLTPVILATQEAGIRRISVQSQYGQIVLKTLSLKKKKKLSQKRAEGVAQGVGPKFKPQYGKKKKKEKKEKKEKVSGDIQSCRGAQLQVLTASQKNPWPGFQRIYGLLQCNKSFRKRKTIQKV